MDGLERGTRRSSRPVAGPGSLIERRALRWDRFRGVSERGWRRELDSGGARTERGGPRRKSRQWDRLRRDLGRRPPERRWRRALESAERGFERTRGFGP